MVFTATKLPVRLACRQKFASEEAAADRFSRNILIPEAAYTAFSADAIMTEESVKAFAKSIGIHPGIVVGPLQHGRRAHYGRLKQLKVKYDFELR